MKKVLLIYPRLADSIEEKALLPLSLLYISALLKDVNVRIIDQRVDKNWEKELLDNLDEDVVCVGISSMTGPQLKHAIDISKTVKKVINVPVIWGGVHASLVSEQTLNNEFVDIVVIGEGDRTFPELVSHLINKKDLDDINGIAYKKDGTIIFTAQRQVPNIDLLPKIPYHLVDINKYFGAYVGRRSQEPYERILAIQTSRGCPHRCEFCYNTTFNKRKWRGKDPDRVIAEINELVEKYNITGIFLLDDNFFANIRRAKEILRRIKDLHIELYNLTCRIDTFSYFDDEFLGFMEEVNVQTIFVGVESGSEDILKRLKKDISIEQVFISSEKLKNTNIKPTYSFMIGFPFETEDDRRKTLRLIYLLKKQKRSAIFGVSIFNPYPSNIMKECIDKGFVDPPRTEDWASDWKNVALPWVSERQMDKFKKIVLSANLLTDPFDFKNIVKKIPSSFLSSLSLFRIKYNFFNFYFEDKLSKFYYKNIKGVIIDKK